MKINTLEQLFAITAGMNARQRAIFDWLYQNKPNIKDGILRISSRALEEAVGIKNYNSVKKGLLELKDRDLIEVVFEKMGAKGAITIVLKFE